MVTLKVGNETQRQMLRVEQVGDAGAVVYTTAPERQQP
jgi:hypothetical protein